MTPAERWATVAGVFSLAAKSPVSGALLVQYETEVTPLDVAEQAGVSLKVASATLEKLKSLHELVRDDTLGAWVIDDWTAHQPAPKRAKPSDSAERTRERKRRSREQTPEPLAEPSHADVTRVTLVESRDVTPPEEKRSELTTPLTPQGEPSLPVRPSGDRQRDRDRFAAECLEFATQRFSDLPSPNREQMVEAALHSGLASVEAVDQYVRQWTPVVLVDLSRGEAA